MQPRSNEDFSYNFNSAKWMAKTHGHNYWLGIDKQSNAYFTSCFKPQPESLAIDTAAVLVNKDGDFVDSVKAINTAPLT